MKIVAQDAEEAEDYFELKIIPRKSENIFLQPKYKFSPFKNFNLNFKILNQISIYISNFTNSSIEL